MNSSSSKYQEVLSSFPTRSNELAESSIQLKPFVKWAGGKTQLLDEIRKKYPKDLGVSLTKYAEPFVGGGAVFFDILSNYDLEEIYISDTNYELITCYKVIKNDVSSLIKLLSKFQEEYIPLSKNERKEYYYEKRDLFNKLKIERNNECKNNEYNELISEKSEIYEKTSIEISALFIFLNRTCFNGLYRENSKGLFNVPIGSYKNPLICDSENLMNISKALKDVKIVCGDYRESNDFIDDKTFVYFDPPYRPITETSSFTAYTKSSFNDDSQRELSEYVKFLNLRNAKILVSNSDPKNTNPKDTFFDDIYSGCIIENVNASRMINSNGSARGKIKELLISNY